MPGASTARRPGARRSGRPHPGRPATSTRASSAGRIGNRASGRILEADGRLSETARSTYEAAFDTDLSPLRVRVSPEARRYDAAALTRGSEITFAPGKLDLSTTTGRARLGHEIAHAVQQSAGRVGADGRYAGAAISRNRRLERQAHDVGDRIARGGRADADLRGRRLSPGRGAVMQRDVDPERQAKIDTLEKKVFFDGLHDYALAGTCDTYKIGLRTYVDHEKYEDMYQARTPMVAERRVREKAKRTALGRDKTLSKLDRKHAFERWQKAEKAKEREAAAREVLGEGATDEEVQKLLQSGTGHTWLEFQRLEGSRRLGKYTFGFSSLAGGVTSKEASAGKSRGMVKNPDNYARPQKGTVRWFDLTAKKYKDALKKALDIKENPPRYSLTGDNCTSFTKKVLAAAGETFPDTGYPVGPGGIGGRVFSPNRLFKAMTTETEL